MESLKTKSKKLKIAVGLSGGVDSAVSATLLKKSGADVVGVFIKTWQPDWVKCTWREERRDAMRVAAHLDIPFITIDLEKEYKEGVADYMISEYKLGRTPNPDVMCNKEVKFGAFLEWAIKNGADAVATGHYSRIRQVPSTNDQGPNKLELLKANDPKKDQSYFLWMLSQEQLTKIIFPIGHIFKSEVRELAKKFKLPVASKRDSQGICFLGDIDMKDFLTHYIKTIEGNVLDENGEIIGKHEGAALYTLGEKWQGSNFVIEKDMNENTITVGSLLNWPQGNLYELDNVNWISGSAPTSKLLIANVRYHGEKLKCTLIGSTIKFDNPTLIAPGQSVVLYENEKCLGGGIVI